MTTLLSRTSGKVACVLFSVFVANILYGKGVVYFSWNAAFQLSDVMEFLLLFFTSVFFVIFMLYQERLK